MSYTAYSDLNSLEEIYFIAGTSYTLIFNVYEDDGVTPLDLSGSTIKWVLSPYGQSDYNILQVNGIITGTNIFKVEIPTTGTELLSGKYIQQPIIAAFSGDKYIPGQGVVTILPITPVT